ncbi:PorP/SprF family type IX secretion system membrane protein [Flavobacterium aquicola]|uniref:Type IX secretion system PorP/SprF family membrane protein n=1 Tax=Flavobacterium aquicola TaxID=1682742 RepID=A0A3E0EI87_9FLAO|nr:type IX secretion system membrane protein PorP/SprF [Flavobacterium aquicola]REG97881.1 type IX secretion system PorP/SprF family membrane protein [Flavobacterium aquicola]
MKKLILLVFFFLSILKASAQQEPHFTQYMSNMSVINPAYATASPSILNLGTLYRYQWAGIKGAPKTITLFAHTPINDKIETGFSLVSDDIGDGVKKQTNLFADFAYVLQLDENQKLSFGVKAGFSTISTNFNGFELNDPRPDLAFESTNETVPNIGIGAYYFTDNYYVGLSVPNILTTEHSGSSNGQINSFGTHRVHGYLTGGYVFDINEAFKLKPAAMAIFVEGAPVSVDLTANVLYNEKFELGAAYRFGDAVSVLMNVNVTPNFRVGYSYDYTTSNLSQFNSGSHEIVLLYNLDLLGKGYNKSPRFF